jgi:hypothetical protein
MKRKRRADHLRRLSMLARDAGKSALANAELSSASGQVIARRMALGVSALAVPGSGDHAEFARMVPEKMEALASASVAVTRLSMKTMADNAKGSADDAASASRAMMDMAFCGSPAAALAVQSRIMNQWFLRGYGQSVAWLATGVKLQRALLRPFHLAATRNARRLG